MSESQNDFKIPHMSSKWDNKNTLTNKVKRSKVTGSKVKLAKMLIKLRTTSHALMNRNPTTLETIVYIQHNGGFKLCLFESWGQGGWRLVRLNVSIYIILRWVTHVTISICALARKLNVRVREVYSCHNTLCCVTRALKKLSALQTLPHFHAPRLWACCNKL